MFVHFVAVRVAVGPSVSEPVSLGGLRSVTEGFTFIPSAMNPRNVNSVNVL
jgi:hypothetical protein